MVASTLESMALEMFEQEYQLEAHRGDAGRRLSRAAGGHVDVCPVSWVIHELLRMVDEHHGQPVENLRPCIRRLIAEKAFAFGPQNTPGQADPESAVDEEVDLIIRALERVRAHALASGQWSEMDCAAESYVG